MKVMKSRNLGQITLIEIMIIVAIIGILIAVAVGPQKQATAPVNVYQNMVETHCLNGFKHTVNSKGFVQQTISETGAGIPCN